MVRFDAWLWRVTRAHLLSWRARLWMIALAVGGTILAFTPLFHLLGFAFSFAMAILVSLASLDLGCALVERLRRAGPPADVTPLRLVGGAALGAALVGLALLVVPLVLISVNALRIRNCDWAFGFQSYLLLPCLSAVLASALGVITGIACGPRRWLRNLAPYAVFLAMVACALWRFYAAPPVFSYNLVSGYFPGNLYDETVDLRAPFYWSRLHQLAIVAALLGACVLAVDGPSLRLRRAWRPARSRLRPAAITAAIAALAMGLHVRAGALGFSIDAKDVQRFLGGRYDTEHFIIYYPPGGHIERTIHLIAEDHEFRHAQVARALGVEMKGRITSYYFATGEDKYRMMGAGQVDMAKPWRKEIYLHHQPFPHEVLRHEIAHVIAGEFGAPVFRVSAATWMGLPLIFNPGLIEGTAVAADWPDHFTRTLTPHQSVKAMLELGLAPPAERVLSTEFLAFSSAQSYTLAGSFVHYLLDVHGPSRLRTLYRNGGDFERIYGKSQREMLREWRAMIDAVELPPGEVETLRERFRRPGIFGRPCPHAIARQRGDMAGHTTRGDLAAAIAVARRVCDQVPGEPIHELELADLLIRAGEVEEGSSIYRAIAESPSVSSTLRAQALGDLAAVAARAGAWPEVEALLGQAAELPLRDNEQRLIEAERMAVRHAGPARAPLRDYFWGYDPRWGADTLVQVARAAAIVVAEPSLGMGHYLVGRNLADRAPAEATRALSRSLSLGLPDGIFEREAARLLAESAYMIGDHELVEQAVAILGRADQPEVTRLYAADWLERLHWKRTGALPALP